jgi:excisionase family DNA binding protein
MMEKMYPNEQLPDRLLKAAEIAEILNISKAYAYQLMKQGNIRTVKIGGAVRVRPCDLEIYIEENLTLPVS